MSTSSGDEDSHQGIPVGGVASLKSGEEGLAVKEISGTEGIKSPGSTCSGPQDTIQQFKPQAGVSTVANATRLPDKVMAILLNDEAPDAIWWLQKGTAFAMQKEKFQTQILDKHFRGNKFKSLVRNLHRWGFKRMTCDSTSAGKTIAFSHKYFRRDKPELVQLIQITKDKDVGDAIRERREALRASLPTGTTPPTALRAGAPTGLLREEGLGISRSSTGILGVSANTSVPRHQQPSLAGLVAAEHNQNLSTQGPDSLIQSLTNEWQRSNEGAARQTQLQAGIALSGGLRSVDNADLLARMAMRGTERDQLEQMKPRVHDAQRVQRLGSLLQAEGESIENVLHSAAFQKQRRGALLQQHLATASLAPQAADAHSRLLLQELAGRSMVGGTPAPGTTSTSLFHTPALLPHSQVTPQILAQRAGNSSSAASMAALQPGWNIEQLLARRNMSSLQQQGSGLSMDGSQRSTQPDAAALTTDELRYLAEIRRRGS